MNVYVELVEDMAPEDIVIRCHHTNDRVRSIQQYLQDQAAAASLTFYKGQSEFYFSVEQVLFFQTEGECVFAHTETDAYRMKYRLYELEQRLPSYFVRSSKSSILNTRQIYSITKNLAASSLVTFRNTHKHIYVSRKYYHDLRRQIRKD